jgi:hypothetical protein
MDSQIFILTSPNIPVLHSPQRSCRQTSECTDDPWRGDSHPGRAAQAGSQAPPLYTID